MDKDDGVAHHHSRERIQAEVRCVCEGVHCKKESERRSDDGKRDRYHHHEGLAHVSKLNDKDDEDGNERTEQREIHRSLNLSCSLQLTAVFQTDTIRKTESGKPRSRRIENG
jgi:hypothetical protein